MAAPLVWDEQQAYEELLYWDRLIQEGHRLLPHDFDRYTRGFTPGNDGQTAKREEQLN